METPTSREAVLRISIEIDKRCHLAIKPHWGEALEVESDFNRMKLAEHRKMLREDLEDFKEHLSGAEVEWPKVTAAIRCLHRRGSLLLFDLFDQRDDLLMKAHILFGRAWRGWRVSGWYPYSPPPPFVEVKAALDEIIPLEILPLMDRSDPEKVQDLRTLSNAVTRFVGFALIVKRVISSIPKPIDNRLVKAPRLPIKFFQNAGLAGVRDEASFFNQIERQIEADGPWPDERLERKVLAARLAHYLRYPELRFDGSTRNTPDQIHHFSCHCNTEGDVTERFSLGLAHAIGYEKEVTIGDLKFQFSRPAAKSVAESLPLVFLNSCGSSQIHPAGAGSFPELFLKNGNRGFIGTEAAIPDRFAARFSGRFYLELLGGRPLGEAIHRAKWAMLRRERNPLGILYTAYANPEIHVSEAIQKGASQ